MRSFICPSSSRKSSWLLRSLSFLDSSDFTLGMTTLIIAHITFCVSYVMIVVRARLEGFDRALEEAAMDLGANELQTFFRITLPLISPGILSGASAGFHSLDRRLYCVILCSRRRFHHPSAANLFHGENARDSGNQRSIHAAADSHNPFDHHFGPAPERRKIMKKFLASLF